MISLSDATFALRLSDHVMGNLLKDRKIVVGILNGEPAMTIDSFKNLAHSSDTQTGAISALALESNRRKRDLDSGEDAKFIQKSKEAIGRYHQYISTLSKIHQFYQERLDCLREESGRVAAYIIYAKVIRLLNFAVLGLEHRYWDVFMLLRPIDEAVDLAKYFSFCSADEPATSHLRKWFRENQSPKHEVVRKVWGQKMDAVLGQQEGNSEQLFRVLYSKKSKELHHTYNGMWENHQTNIVGDVLKVTGFDYGPSSNPRKIWEVVSFFQSSIWTAVTGFAICFRETIPLEQRHLDELLALDRYFRNEG